MRVSYVCIDPGVPVFGAKGASVHVQEVVRALRRAGHEVVVYTTRRGDLVPADLADLEVVEAPVRATDPARREREQAGISRRIAHDATSWSAAPTSSTSATPCSPPRWPPSRAPARRVACWRSTPPSSTSSASTGCW